MFQSGTGSLAVFVRLHPTNQTQSSGATWHIHLHMRHRLGLGILEGGVEVWRYGGVEVKVQREGVGDTRT